jgi:hypothetical protein
MMAPPKKSEITLKNLRGVINETEPKWSAVPDHELVPIVNACNDERRWLKIESDGKKQILKSRRRFAAARRSAQEFSESLCFLKEEMQRFEGEKPWYKDKLLAALAGALNSVDAVRPFLQSPRPPHRPKSRWAALAGRLDEHVRLMFGSGTYQMAGNEGLGASDTSPWVKILCGIYELVYDKQTTSDAVSRMIKRARKHVAKVHAVSAAK